jgi:two-component system OmpR family sensor kinase
VLVDLIDVATDAVENARVVQPGRPVTLTVAAEPDVSPLVRGDDARLRQVAGNLVGNALTHTSRDTPVTVHVGVDRHAGQHWATIAVADSGPGMPSEQAAHVFERFYRADESRQRGTGGAGLGLSIVAAIVAAHDGTVTVDSKTGAGTLFRVRLPLADEPDQTVNVTPWANGSSPE